ncbi:MAG: hypothetical protein KBA40_03650 [Candidatus Peribacteraceae bacterium]|nr:hypothetical protein [Candidatus Peribacteraceae bacterium]
MLEELETELPGLLSEQGKWKGVVLDAMPQVNRLYRNWREGLRIFLHRIDPCPKVALAILHYHPGPSIVKIHKGGYRQALAYGEPSGPTPPICATVDMEPGSVYEMVHPNLWHAPIPTESASWSTMIVAMGTWRTPIKITPQLTNLRLPQMNQIERDQLFKEFEEFYPPA